MPRPTDVARRIAVAARMLARDVLRRPVTLLLLFLVPALFDGVVLATTSSRSVEVTIASLVEEGAEIATPEARPDPFDLGLLDNGSRSLDQRALSLIFLGHTAVCFLACVFAFFLVHRRRDIDARLVLTGYRPSEVLAAKVIVLVALVAMLAVYETAMLRAVTQPRHLERMVWAFLLGGLVYGCFGLLLGAVVRQELEGMLLIVFLANVDVGWLQNPIYYAASVQRDLIESLPGHGSTQLALAGAFTDRIAANMVWKPLVYAAVALAAALLAFALRIRPAPARATGSAGMRQLFTKVMVVSYLVWIVSFQVVGRFAATLPTVDLTTAWDRAIPLVPGFVWFYEACYVFPLLPILLMRDWHRFNQALVALLLANLTAFAVYLLLPVAFARPALGTGLAERILALEYALDFHPGANKLPSMHVAITWIIACALHGQARRRAVDAAVFVLAVVITASTVLVKQHIVIDAAAGVVWGLAAWWAARAIYPRLVDGTQDAGEALWQLLSPGRWLPFQKHAGPR